MPVVTAVIASYLVGSIPFGYIIGKMKGVDIRQHGSGNIGATNVWRTVGPGWGLLALVLDALKGAAGVGMGKLAGIDGVELLAGIAALLGHAFPVFLGFRGGKIIAAGLGVMTALAPLVALIAVIIFAVVVLFTRYVSLGSICGALSVPMLLALFQYSSLYLLFGVVVCLFAVLKHIPNIRRLLAGTESRINFRKP
ncbi:MAG: glycerol-3-phosphate 1-O-acyltransferase PlsY [Peptococcaceae bacterium]|nr:glycerol-3-phosphate 1-O-acyltransferase PlsY [Peptococcaceae bacterium]